MVNFAYVEEETAATHALAFLVRGLSTDLKHVNSYYFPRDLTLFQVMPLFWKSASVLELSKDLVQDLKCDVVYASFISLLTPPPDEDSSQPSIQLYGSDLCSTYMWNNGKFLLFRHIADLVLQ